MLNLQGVLLLINFVGAEWVEIRPPPKQVREQSKGDDSTRESCSDSSPCLPDIHSWTAATWRNAKNTTRGETPLPTGPRSSEGKLLVLRALHEDLMKNIVRRVEDLGESREARTLPKGMGSKETALITISLLTFAVYLIKLVTMLINIIQEKKGGMNTGTEFLQATSQPSTQTFVVAHGRKKRELDETNARILQLLGHIHEER